VLVIRKKKIMKAKLLLLISSVLLSVSCKKECPSFNRDLLMWLPQNLNDTLIFTNNLNDTISFVVNEKRVYDDNSKYGGKDKYQCCSETNFNAVSLQNSEYFIRENILYPKTKEIYFTISLYHNGKRGEFSLFTTSINKNVLSFLIIDNQEYKNVIVLENDTIEYPDLSGFWKLIISKDVGIVKFYEKGNNSIWTLLK
jgi:hypothetical protein